MRVRAVEPVSYSATGETPRRFEPGDVFDMLDEHVATCPAGTVEAVEPAPESKSKQPKGK